MASNATQYNNLTPAQPLDKKTLNKMVWRSLNLQGSFNYERMQAGGWLYGDSGPDLRRFTETMRKT